MLNPTSRWFAHFVPRTPLVGALAAGLMLCATCAHADEWCTLKLKDGRTISGTLVVKNDVGVTLRPEGGENIAFATAEITDIKLQKSPREEYALKRAIIKDDDMAGRVALLQQFYYANLKSAPAKAFAKAEAEQLAKDFPDSEHIKTLSRVMSQTGEKPADADAQPPVAVPESEDGKPAPHTPAGVGPAVKAAPVVLMSEDEQNLLRLYQLDFSVDKNKGRISGPDAKANVVIAKEVVEELFKTKGDEEELKEFKLNGTGQLKFRALPALVQLDTLFAVRARALYPKVKVKTEPASLQAFRTKIHALLTPAVIPQLAPQVPGLIAKPKNANAQVEAYTNFLALSLASVEGHPVIDRDTPEDSLVLQWGLPRAVAKYAAPETLAGWKPYFAGKNDPRFLEISRWIKSLQNIPQITAENLPLPVPPVEKPKVDPKHETQPGRHSRSSVGGGAGRAPGASTPNQP